MIDFRYHLVSLISVFLALAVGIVLGAGPLQQTIGSQLASQVEQLRSEKDALRSENDRLTKREAALSSYVIQTAPQLLAGRLDGADVAIVTDDQSTSQSADATAALLKDAGAASVRTVSLGTNLWDPAKADERSRALAGLRDAAPGLELTGDDDSARLGGAITQLLTTRAEGLTSSERAAAIDVLKKEKILSVDGDETGPAGSLIYLASAPGALATASDSPTAAAQRSKDVTSAQSALLLRLAQDGTPAVVAGMTPGADDTSGLVRTVRGDSQLQSISSVDGLQRADGPPTAVMALVEQIDGGRGAYGTAPGASARVPELPASSGGSGTGTKTKGSQASDGGQG